MAPITRRGAARSGVASELSDDLSEEYERGRQMASQSGLSDSYVVDEMELDQDNPSNSLHDDDDSAFIDHHTIENRDQPTTETEKFAEHLDRYTSKRQKQGNAPNRQATLNLIDSYLRIAEGASKALGSDHLSDLQAEVRQQWQAVMNQFDAPGGSGIPDISALHLSSSTFQSRDSSLSTWKEWEEEAQTWKLLKEIIELDYSQKTEPTHDLRNPSTGAALHPYSSDDEIWDFYLGNDKEARKQKIILDWLKSTAEITGEDTKLMREHIEKEAKNHGEPTDGWQATRLALKDQKRIRNWPHPIDPNVALMSRSLRTSDKSELLVTQLDPDAPTRQSRVLEKPDRALERFIWFACWQMLRRGESFDTIRDYCAEYREEWRAVMIRGNQTTKGDGNTAIRAMDLGLASSHGLWRDICYSAAQHMSSDADPFERAILGVLSGDLRSVEPACRSWDDFLFAHYNSLSLRGFNQFILSTPQLRQPILRSRMGQSDRRGGKGEEYNSHIIGQLSPLLSNLKSPQKLLKSLHGALISNQFSKLAGSYGSSIGDKVPAGDPLIAKFNSSSSKSKGTALYSPEDRRGLRIMAHTLFVFQDLGLQVKDTKTRDQHDNIVLIYLRHLRDHQRYDMLPLYASRLTSDKTEAALGQLLSLSMQPELRIRQVQLMEKLNIKPLKVVNHLLLDITERSAPRNYKQIVKRSGILSSTTDAPSPSNNSTATKTKKLPRINASVYTAIKKDELAMVHGFEWYLAIRQPYTEDLKETMLSGTSLYIGLLGQGSIAAAIELQKKMPSDAIWAAKAVTVLERENRNEENVEAYGYTVTFNTERMILQKKMRLYNDFDSLAYILGLFQRWSVLVEQAPARSHLRAESSNQWKSQLRDLLEELDGTVPNLFVEFLTKTQFRINEDTLRQIRHAYVPDMILAYISVLVFAGHVLSRSLLTKAIELVQQIAEDDHEECDLLECFVATGRVSELVDVSALVSKEMLKAAGKGSKSGGSWKTDDTSNLNIWNVKQI